jgi:hypothetical protein
MAAPPTMVPSSMRGPLLKSPLKGPSSLPKIGGRPMR